ncbi:carbohydrate-binding protein [Fulvivirga sp. 29W222]|uniref:Carbohydrate-binding protein n=1 Tax=Fulvivirga marina TaxID=2494733 RepID=A0A937G1A6_9BACT|nr:glycosyl hydrolase family 18 protein [Fulvivirga marina]MBL6449965.1 carbohydrate-binding protein [Fulvivirga marina]
MKNYLRRGAGLFSRLTLVLLFSALVVTGYGQRIVGYTTSWVNNANQIDYAKLTHINYSFALPTTSGSLEPVANPAKLNSVVSQAHGHGVKVLIAIGGWDLGDGGGNDSRFEVIASTATGRNNFVNSVISFIQQYNLDGADIDWEFPDAVNGNPDPNFTALMGALSSALHSRGLLLTAAVNASAWAGAGVSSEVFGHVDWLNIMAYDGDAGAGHSPYSYAESALNYWKGRGLPANKAVLGVPFYARPSWNTYSTLLSQGADPYADYFNGDYYNGINTIKAKTNLGVQQGGGIMIWSIDHDVQNQYSLLTAIYDEMGTPPQNDPVTVFKHCDYGGYAVGLPVGSYTLAQLQARGILDNDISSIKVQSGYKITLYAADNFSGTSVVKTSDDNCLVNENFNDAATSVIVGQSSGGFSQTIQAESYSNMSGVQLEGTTDNGGGQNVGWIDTGDWMVYSNVNIPTSGTYLVEYRVASLNGGGQLSLDVNAGATVLGSRSIASTGGWQNWTTVSHTVYINAGTYNFGIYAQTGGWNLNWWKITYQSSASEARIAQDKSNQPPENQQINNLVYPNPFNNTIRVNTKDHNTRVTITDALGQEMTPPTNITSGEVIDLSELKQGLYFIQIESGGKQETQRLIKQ